MSESREFLIEFIELYKSFPCLWQVTNKDYSDRNRKDVAYNELVEKYKQIDPSANRSKIVKRINSLRTVYRKELSKVNKSLRSGSGSDEVYKPTLWYFELLHFLSDFQTARTSRSTIDDSDDETRNEVNDIGDNISLDVENENYEESPTETRTTTPTPSGSRPSKRKLSLVEQATLETMKKVGKKIDSVKADDPHDVFGKHVADRLRNIKTHQVTYAQKLISDVLFEADMETLNRFCRITTDPMATSQISGNLPFTYPQTPFYMQQTKQTVNVHPPEHPPRHPPTLYIPQQMSPAPSGYASGSSAKEFIDSFNLN